jgi:hypothetical protein
MPFRGQRAASVRAEASPYLPTMWGMPSGRACHCESRPAGRDGAQQSRGERRDPATRPCQAARGFGVTADPIPVALDLGLFVFIALIAILGVWLLSIRRV